MATRMWSMTRYLHTCCCVQKTGVLENIEKRKFGSVLSTETALAGVNMGQFRHIVYYDYSPGMLSVGACALQHASVTFFLQPQEHLAVEVLQLSGMPLPPKPAQHREFHVELEKHTRNSIEKVLSLI